MEGCTVSNCARTVAGVSADDEDEGRVMAWVANEACRCLVAGQRVEVSCLLVIGGP